MGRIKWKGSAIIAPVPPTMVTCNCDGKDNVFTVAWTGVLNTRPPKTYISVRPERFSYELIKQSGEFVINLTTSSMVKSADFCGTYTGRKVDKFKKCNLERIESSVVSCPTLTQSPLSLECKVTDVVSLGSHDMFIADIIAITVDEQYLDKNGKLNLSAAKLAAYAHGEYFELGRKIGNFGFSVRRKNNGKQQKNKF